MKSNNFKIGDQVMVYGYDSTATFNYGFQGTVVESDDLTVKVLLSKQNYHTRVWFGQCRSIDRAESEAVA